jgi:hypothetical protein
VSLRIVRWVALLALDRAALLAELLLALLAELLLALLAELLLALLSTESLGSAFRVLFVGLMGPCIAPKTVGVTGALVSGGVCSGLKGVGGRGSGCENIGNRVACSGSITNRSVTNRSVVTKSGERVFEIFILGEKYQNFS